VTDVEIYKNGGATPRASDAGYTLLDTDGIDFDGLTGIHGFSVNLADNTDAGFYAVGSFYWVVVSAITVDTQTVNFIAAVFRIGPAEASTGDEAVDAAAISGDATAADNLELACDNYSVTRGLTGTALPAAAADAAGGLPISDAGGLDLDGLVAATVLAILKTDWTGITGEADRSVLNALRFLRNKWSITGTTLTVRKEDDSTSAWTSALTTDAAAAPITASDPAGP
jgi:hypothetical protein